MTISSEGLWVILGGCLNGLHVFPVRKQNSLNAYLWLYFGLFTYFLIPVCFLIWLKSSILLGTWIEFLSLMMTGLAMGLGVWMLSQSIAWLGVGIPFGMSIAMTNISGSIFGSLMNQGWVHILSHTQIQIYLISTLAIILYSLSLSKREQTQPNSTRWKKGLLLCLIGSILNSTQGAAISYYTDLIKIQGDALSAQVIPWCLIFVVASFVFVPIYLKDVLKIHRTRLPSNALTSHEVRRIAKGSAWMTFSYLASVALYLAGSALAPAYSERSLWIFFMMSILFSSMMASYFQGEWKKASKLCHLYNVGAMGLVLIVILIKI